MDPTLAKVVFHAWAGEPAVVVGSPPGAGKTSLVSRAATVLATEAQLRVPVVCQTNAQALEVANRLGALSDQAVLVGASGERRPAGLHPNVAYADKMGAKADRRIVVATTAKWLWTDPRAVRADVLVVDEAW